MSLASSIHNPQNPGCSASDHGFLPGEAFSDSQLNIQRVFHFVSGTNESMLKCSHRTLHENSRTPLGHNHPILLLFMTSAALVELEALYCRGLFKLLHRLTWIV
jgi:hypothetical protein